MADDRLTHIPTPPPHIKQRLIILCVGLLEGFIMWTVHNSQAVSVGNVSIAAADSNNNDNIVSNLRPKLNEDDRAGSDNEETIQRKHQQREAIQPLLMK
eukprot:scaffold66051_cov72-Cyclotella_meneghiniana.AAC.2